MVIEVPALSVTSSAVATTLPSTKIAPFCAAILTASAEGATAEPATTVASLRTLTLSLAIISTFFVAITCAASLTKTLPASGADLSFAA